MFSLTHRCDGVDRLAIAAQVQNHDNWHSAQRLAGGLENTSRHIDAGDAAVMIRNAVTCQTAFQPEPVAFQASLFGWFRHPWLSARRTFVKSS